MEVNTQFTMYGCVCVYNSMLPSHDLLSDCVRTHLFQNGE